MTDSIASQRVPRISFEFFPPRTLKASAMLWESVQRLTPLAPEFVSVTYGAGGNTQQRTMAAILAIRDGVGLDVAGHLTCVGADRDSVLRIARAYKRLGCRRIVALRGDPPKGSNRFVPHPGGFASSVELIEALSREGGFEIWVGAYPETHPEAASAEADIDHLKRKLDAGAAGAITQFFFDNGQFHRFRELAARAGIAKPILPGILPITDFDKALRFARSCGASVPDWMVRAATNAADQDAQDLLALAVAADQCDDLIANGVEHLHLYTLNRPELPYRLATALGLRPRPPLALAVGGCT